MRHVLRPLAAALVATCAGLVPLAAADAIKLVPAFPKLTFDRPVGFTQLPDGTGRYVVLEQHGRIVTFAADDAEKTVFLDWIAKTNSGGNEQGLLSFAFHPDFKTNGVFFIYYTAAGSKKNTLSRLKSTADHLHADPASEEILIQVENPYDNHNGGTLLFGKDGFLYLSKGDGGAGGDPHANGQKMDTFLAKILRIDPDHPADGKPYGIPKDNPFVGKAGVFPEIYAYGVRNPWRMSFDRKTGELWAGEVGQNIWEEIDIITKGGNYGWNHHEGHHAFENKPPVPGAIEPIWEYKHDIGQSITGGYVYRGKRFTALEGVYIYADFQSTRIWGLKRNGDQVENHQLAQAGKNITSFGEDVDGEVYLTTFEGGGWKEGKVYRVEQ